MPSRAEICRQLCQPGIIAVVRAQSAGQIPALVEALLQGGVSAVEITLTIPGAVQALRSASSQFGARALIGAGSVLDLASCRECLAAGAQFIVSPICRPELADPVLKADRAIMLGACTPTEAQTAHEAGADFVKIFPADNLGPRFIRALLAPMPHLRLVPTGGVDLKNAAEFMRAGSAALGVGGALVSPAILKTNDWPQLTRLARQFVETVQSR
jgi:2-dehydro-3-deoxyphosphogluconate aldolase/(4S)-4-hydroxy-2-oxoglutarate aldolase